MSPAGSRIEIDPGDVDAHAARRTQAAQLGDEVLRLLHQLGRDHALGDDPLLAVDVVEEHLQRLQPLHQAALDAAPLVGGDHARHQAHRHDLLRAALIGVDRERHALFDQRQVGQRLAARELVGREAVEQPRRGARVRPRLALGVDELVVGSVGGAIAVQEQRPLLVEQHDGTLRRAIRRDPSPNSSVTKIKPPGNAPFTSGASRASRGPHCTCGRASFAIPRRF